MVSLKPWRMHEIVVVVVPFEVLLTRPVSEGCRMAPSTGFQVDLLLDVHLFLYPIRYNARLTRAGKPLSWLNAAVLSVTHP
jgi:hypothetical protein